MARQFAYEKFIVYQKALQFTGLRTTLLNGIVCSVAACDHLERSSESIVINIAHSSNSWFPKERSLYLGNANGSALESSACLDIIVAKNLIDSGNILPGKELLSEIVSMLMAMRKTSDNRVCENNTPYNTRLGCLFNHEKLDVYQTALHFIGFINPLLIKCSCSNDLRSKIDKSTTSIVLNIAEGGGRFTKVDQAKFYQIAFKAVIQSAALLDLAFFNHQDGSEITEESHSQLHRIASMITALHKTVSQ